MLPIDNFFAKSKLTELAEYDLAEALSSQGLRGFALPSCTAPPFPAAPRAGPGL